MCARHALVLALMVPGAAPAGPAVTTPTALAKSCEGRDGWSDAAPPARIFGNVYYVGTCGITVLLITSQRGHILIDGATAEAAPGIVANIRTLGFEPRDIRTILSSHEHLDHVGGLAALQMATGAQMVARKEARMALESGRADADDPQTDIIGDFRPVRVDRLIADGKQVRVGGLSFTAIATPGHTAGSTSWTWRSCEARVCRTFVYADSLSAVSAEGYRFSRHPALLAIFRATFAKVARLRCDILITPHPQASGLFERLAGRSLLSDSRGCGVYAANAARRLDDRLAEERGLQ